MSAPHERVSGISRLVVLATLLITARLSGQWAWHEEQFMSESGLLQNRVHAMVRDRFGALLIGTEGGLVRYDGHHFRQIGIGSEDGMAPSRVLEIIPAEDGVFVVRDAGCRQYLYAGDMLHGVTMEAPARPYLSRFAGSIPSAEVAVRAMDPDTLFEGKPEWPMNIRPVALGGLRWCLRIDTMLFVYQGEELVDRLPLPAGRTSFLFTVDGVLHTMDHVGHVYRVDLGSRNVTRVRVNGFSPGPNFSATFRLFWDPQQGVTTILVDGTFHVLQGGGDGILEAVALDIPLPKDARVGSLVWLEGMRALAIGTDTKGLFLYRKQEMVSHLCPSTADGVNNAFNAQAPFGRSSVLTSNRRGARMFSAMGCEVEAPPIKWFNDLAIILDKDQRYWYGRGDTLLVYDVALGEERVVRTDMRPLCFFEEADVLWIGTGKGVYQSSQGSIKLYQPINEGDLSLRPLAIRRTTSGELWMASCSGVFRIAPKGGWEAVPGLSGICARELALVDGLMFVGTYGSGAYVVQEGRVYKLPLDGQGFLSHVHAFMPDALGFLWMSTNQGLFRVRLDDLRVWMSDPADMVYFAYYGKRSGITNAEFNGGCSPAFVRTDDGWASFPTMDGLVWFRPEDVPDAYPGSGFLVESVEVDGRPWAMGDPIQWNHKDVVIVLSLTYWGAPENVQLEYTLDDGGGSRWVRLASDQREIHLGAVPKGRHTLRVRKVGARHRGDAHELALGFHVQVPYFRQPWFFMLLALLAVFLFMGGIRLNAMRLRRRNMQLERMVSLRTEELVRANEVLRRSLEMKEMLVSIISHDIVTPLRFLARVTEGAARRLPEPADAILSGTLTDVARSSDKLFANAQDLLQWIKRQDGRIDLRVRQCSVHALVEEVLDRERERAQDEGTSLINEVPDSHSIWTDRNVLSIILHNAVANAVTHTRKGTVKVSGSIDGDRYVLAVADTGEGMPTAVMAHVRRVQEKGALGAMNAEGERDVQGLGLLIIADLLELLGGGFDVRSGQGHGTVVSLRIPFKAPSNGSSSKGVL